MNRRSSWIDNLINLHGMHESMAVMHFLEVNGKFFHLLLTVSWGYSRTMKNHRGLSHENVIMSKFEGKVRWECEASSSSFTLYLIDSAILSFLFDIANGLFCPTLIFWEGHAQHHKHGRARIWIRFNPFSMHECLFPVESIKSRWNR